MSVGQSIKTQPAPVQAPKGPTLDADTVKAMAREYAGAYAGILGMRDTFKEFVAMGLIPFAQFETARKALVSAWMEFKGASKETATTWAAREMKKLGLVKAKSDKPEAVAKRAQRAQAPAAPAAQSGRVSPAIEADPVVAPLSAKQAAEDALQNLSTMEAHVVGMFRGHKWLQLIQFCQEMMAKEKA